MWNSWNRCYGSRTVDLERTSGSLSAHITMTTPRTITLSQHFSLIWPHWKISRFPGAPCSRHTLCAIKLSAASDASMPFDLKQCSRMRTWHGPYGNIHSGHFKENINWIELNVEWALWIAVALEIFKFYLIYLYFYLFFNLRMAVIIIMLLVLIIDALTFTHLLNRTISGFQTLFGGMRIDLMSP